MNIPDEEFLSAVFVDINADIDICEAVADAIPSQQIFREMVNCPQLDKAITEAGLDSFRRGSIGSLTCSLPAPLVRFLTKMDSLDRALSSCQQRVGASLERFAEFIGQHSQMALGDRYLVRDDSQGRVFAFQTGHETSIWWLSHNRRYEHYCRSPLFAAGSEWWRMATDQFVRTAQSVVNNAGQYSRLNCELLREIVANENAAMRATIEGVPFFARSTPSGHLWLTPEEPVPEGTLDLVRDEEGLPVMRQPPSVEPDETSAGVQSSESESSALRSALRYKKDPPFGPRTSNRTKLVVQALMRDYIPGMNVAKWCKNYAEDIGDSEWDCRQVVFKYLEFPSTGNPG